MFQKVHATKLKPKLVPFGRVQKYSLQSTDTLCNLSYTFRLPGSAPPVLQTRSKSEKKRFLKDCKTTLDFAGKVESWLKGWLLPSIIPIVSSMSINLRVPRGMRKLNSCLIVAPRGSGKTELLEHILAASNHRHFVVLPPKIFESDLVKKGREYFHNKVMVLSDLIVTFEGMARKQREQLVNFWTKLLEGNYARDRDALENVSTLALFGLASEQLDKFRDELMSATFLDRVPPFKHNVTTEMKREILQFRAKLQRHEEEYKPPVLKLPLPEKIDDSSKIQVAFPRSREIENRIVEYALELDKYHVQSFARAQDYIRNFMRANALLNNRRRVTVSDLYLYDLVHPLFLGSTGTLGPESLVLSLFSRYPGCSDNELIEKSELSRGTFYKYKRILQARGAI